MGYYFLSEDIYQAEESCHKCHLCNKELKVGDRIYWVDFSKAIAKCADCTEKE